MLRERVLIEPARQRSAVGSKGDAAATAGGPLAAMADRLESEAVLVYRCKSCDGLAEEPLCEGCNAAAGELRALCLDFSARRALEAEPAGRTLPRPVRVVLDGEAPSLKLRPV